MDVTLFVNKTNWKDINPNGEWHNFIEKNKNIELIVEANCKVSSISYLKNKEVGLTKIRNSFYACNGKISGGISGKSYCVLVVDCGIYFRLIVSNGLQKSTKFNAGEHISFQTNLKGLNFDLGGGVLTKVFGKVKAIEKVNENEDVYLTLEVLDPPLLMYDKLSVLKNSKLEKNICLEAL